MIAVLACHLIVSVWLVTRASRAFEAVLPLFAMLAVLIPSESKTSLPGLYDLTTTRLAIMTLTALYVTTRGAPDPDKPATSTPLKYLLLFNLGWSLLSALNSIVFAMSLKNVLSSAFDFFLLYYIFANSVTSIRSAEKVIEGMLAGLAGCCIIGLAEIYWGMRVLDLFPAVTYRFSNRGFIDDVRVRSTFPHSILFANALALGIPWALYFLKSAKTAGRKVYLWALLLLMFWNIYKSMSRGPWIALGLSLLLMFPFSGKFVRKALAGLVLLSVAVCVIRPGVWETLKNTYKETNNPDSPRGSSYQYRYTIMRQGANALNRGGLRAIWGFGQESFSHLGLQDVNPFTGNVYPIESCDSGFVEVMVGTGYVGLGLVIALLVNPVGTLLHAWRKMPKPANLFCLVAAINVVAYILMMTCVENWGWGQQTHMFWILLAVSLAYPRLCALETATEARSTPPTAAELAPWLTA